MKHMAWKRKSWLSACLLVIVGLVGCASPFKKAVTEEPSSIVDSFAFEPEAPPVFTYAEGLRITALNTEFMFDGTGDEGEATFPHKGDPEKARAHRDRIGRVIRMLDADVVLLVEVENREVMQLLIEESLSDLSYEAYFVQGQDMFTGQDVGLLSRVPIEYIGRTDERAPVGVSNSTYGVSKNLYARLNLGVVPTTIIGLHFLARPDDPTRLEKREAQAAVISQLVEQEIEAGRAVVVLGDFNDFDDEVLDIRGSQPITKVLSRIKAAGPGEEDDLHNVIADVSPRERYTAHWDRNRNEVVEFDELSAIDHILLSPELYRRVREVVYVQAHDPLTYTDHFPIVINLDVN